MSRPRFLFSRYSTLKWFPVILLLSTYFILIFHSNMELTQLSVYAGYTNITFDGSEPNYLEQTLPELANIPATHTITRIPTPRQTTQHTFSNPLKILVPFYNPSPQKLQNCLESIARQNINEYDVCIVDDASNKYVQQLHAIMDKYCDGNPNWTKIIKSENSGTLHSNVMAINKLAPRDMDILVILDGDDALFDVDVFSYLRHIYNDKKTMITFGGAYHRINNCTEAVVVPSCRKWPWKKIIKNNNWRNVHYITTHLKTFRYELFKRVKPKDLKRHGKYITSATDVATMIPLIEMAGDRFKCIEKALYIYNNDNPNSHHNNEPGKSMQLNNEKFVRRNPIYEPIVKTEVSLQPDHTFRAKYNETKKEYFYSNQRKCVLNPVAMQ
eukprot:85751_1